MVESIMIILSVLIALFINEWRTAYNEKLRTQIMLDNLENEILINKEYVDGLIVYHEGVQKKIKHIFLQDSIQQYFFSSKGFQIHKVAKKGIIQGQLNDIAWTVAKDDKITNRISLQESQVLFAVYEQQEIVNQTIKRIIDFLSTRETHRIKLVEESVIIFETELNELTEQEKNLKNKYIETLDKIKKKRKRK